MRVFFTRTISVSRLTSASSKESYGANGTIKGYITPLSAQEVFVSEGNPAQQYKLITGLTSDVKKTDRITCDGVTYIVTGVQKYEFGAMKRMEAHLEQFNS